MATSNYIILSVADVANSPAAPWTNKNNTIDADLTTAASITALSGASDFLDCLLANPPPSATAITGWSCTVRLSAFPNI